MMKLLERWPARLLVSDLLSAGLSAAVLMWRGHVDNGHAAAPVNAVSHWLWPREALRRDTPSLRFTGTGIAVHFAAALLWCGLYEALRGRRGRAGARHAVGDAAAVGAVSAVVDLACVPDRLTPGFEKRITPPSLLLVYTAFAAGLALSGLAALRNR